jgi:SAM-dependent methyltransferase
MFLRTAGGSLRLTASAIRGLKRIFSSSKPAAQTLSGDRDLEWSWMSAQIPEGPGVALDFGPGGSHLALIAAQRGFQVTSIDLERPQWMYSHSNLQFVAGDILNFPFQENHFDLVLNCSTVEHVGLSGRYGVTEERTDGDLEAMSRLRHLLKPGGQMLLTIPVGRDSVFAPLHRIYGEIRLPQLLQGFRILKEEFWMKDDQNRWIKSDRTTALSFQPSAASWDPLQNIYALGFFVLEKQNA